MTAATPAQAAQERKRIKARRRRDREIQRRLKAGVPRRFLTTDPAVAAGVRETADFSWVFPHGKRWKIHPSKWSRVLTLYRHKFWTTFRNPSVKRWVNDDVFLLRLDMLRFAGEIEEAHWTEEQLGIALAYYLRPGREEWGGADEDDDDDDFECGEPDEDEEELLSGHLLHHAPEELPA